jgi:lysyl-tRNA synthetase class 2
MQDPSKTEPTKEEPKGEEGKKEDDDEEVVGADGKKISKNEQKRLAKQAQKEKEKEEKLKKKAEEEKNKPKKEGEKEKEEEILDPQLYFQNRSKKVNKLLENPAGEHFPFPHKWHIDLIIPEFIQKYEPKCPEKGVFLDEVVSIAGRIHSLRQVSAKLIFYDLVAENAKVQLMVNAKNYENEAEFEELVSILRRGDIIGAKGNPGRTQPGEFSLRPTKLKLLAPCLHMLPMERVGVKDPDVRYRQRYLDLICNKGIREKFITRTKVIKFVRKYLDDHGFLEVETPTLNMIPGGAAAKPFLTHHNELKLQMFMRIATELYLKQLIVGGIDRVYEIGKNFRNEGMDQTHNPEFTLCEFYWAYKDVYDLMDFTEEMLSTMVQEITGGTVVTIHKEDGSEVKIDFKRPWKRIPMMEELEKRLATPLPADLESEQARVFFEEQAKKHGVDCKPPRTTSRLIDKLVGHFIEVDMINPTFLIEHPQLMSPLAKYHRSKPNVTERFELFINKQEFANAYTELNDPFKQRQLFEDQAKEKAAGNDEAMPIDEEFIKSMEHALPPTAGWGLGIDRLVMLLTDSLNIQEVILFPAMKPINHDSSHHHHHEKEHKPAEKKAEAK